MDLKEQCQQAQHDLEALKDKFGDSSEVQRIEDFLHALSTNIADLREGTNTRIQKLNIPNPVVGSTEAPKESPDQIIERVVVEGRLRGYASLGAEYSKKRGWGPPGNGYFKDPRLAHIRPFPEKGGADNSSGISESIGFSSHWPMRVKEAGADAAIGLSKVGMLIL